MWGCICTCARAHLLRTMVPPRPLVHRRSRRHTGTMLSTILFCTHAVLVLPLPHRTQTHKYDNPTHPPTPFPARRADLPGPLHTPIPFETADQPPAAPRRRVMLNCQDQISVFFNKRITHPPEAGGPADEQLLPASPRRRLPQSWRQSPRNHD